MAHCTMESPITSAPMRHPPKPGSPAWPRQPTEAPSWGQDSRQTKEPPGHPSGQCQDRGRSPPISIGPGPCEAAPRPLLWLLGPQSRLPHPSPWFSSPGLFITTKPDAPRVVDQPFGRDPGREVVRVMYPLPALELQGVAAEAALDYHTVTFVEVWTTPSRRECRHVGNKDRPARGRTGRLSGQD